MPEGQDFEKLLAIAREPVKKSSNVAAYGYDKLMQVITIEFHNESVYAYFNCSEEDYAELEAANSKGKYIHEKLIDKKEYVQIA